MLNDVFSKPKPWENGPDDFVFEATDPVEDDDEQIDEEPELSNYIGYCDRPMAQDDQAAYDAYLAREQAHLASKGMVL